MPGGHVQSGIGEPGKVHPRFALMVQARGQGAVFQLVDIAVIGELFLLPQALDDVEELPGTFVAQVVFEEIPIGPLTGRVATGDDVPVQAAPAQVLQDRCLLRGVGGQGPGGLEGNQELDTPGFPGQRGRDDPWLGPGGQQCPFEAGQLGGLGHLGDVVDVGETVRLAIGQAPRGDMAGAVLRIAPVVFVSGQLRTIGAQRQAPEKFSAHGCS